MRKPATIIAVLSLCLVVVGCESKCDSLTPPTETTGPDFASDPATAPLAAALSEATPGVEKLAVIALLLSATGRMTADDANRGFDNDVAAFAAGRVDSAKIDQVLDSTVDAYVAMVQAKTRSGAVWPASRDPDVWATAAALQISVALDEIKDARARGAIPTAAIRHLSRAEGWARGEETPQNDPLAGYDALVERGVAALSNVPPPQGP